MPATAVTVVTDSSVPSVTSTQPTGSTASSVRARGRRAARDLRERAQRDHAEQRVRGHGDVVEHVAAQVEGRAGDERDPRGAADDREPGIVSHQPGEWSHHTRILAPAPSVWQIPARPRWLSVSGKRG